MAVLWPIASKDKGARNKDKGTKLKACLLLLLLYFLMGQLQAQEIKPLNIGDRVPDRFWEQEHLVYKNGKTSKETLGKYKGKALVLDFWATWCGACIVALPKLDSINSVGEAKAKVLVLPISYQNEDVLRPFFKKNKYVNLGFIYSDKYYGGLFPHQVLPHYVWINSLGEVVKFTESVGDGKDVLSQFTAEGKVNLSNKVDVELVKHDMKKPFLINGNGGDGANMLYHSLLTSYAGNIVSGSSVSHSDRGWKIAAFDVPIAKLFRLAYGVTRKYLNDKNVVYNVKDKSKLTSNLKGEAYNAWRAKGNAFSYEISAPDSFKGEQVFEMMQKELSMLFRQYKVSEELKPTAVLALVKTDELERFAAKGSPFEVKYDASGIKVSNSTFDQLIVLLETTFLSNSDLTVIDETGYLGRIDLSLNTDFKNIEMLNAALLSYGLKFIQVERPIKKLIIADNDQFNQGLN